MSVGGLPEIEAENIQQIEEDLAGTQHLSAHHLSVVHTGPRWS